MAYNYSALHAAIKAVLVAAGFVYAYPQDWGNFESGEFPEALSDKGFAIKFSTQSRSQFEEVSRKIANIVIEFSLESANDLYLTLLDDAVAAIESLSGVTATGLGTIYRNDDAGESDLTDFAPLYLPKDIGNGKVIIQFSNIRCEIEG